MTNLKIAAFGLAVGVVAMGAAGCATKTYVRSQTAPLVDHTDQLDTKTAANNQQIHAVDDKAQAGIKQAQGAADAANQNAQAATKDAGDAQVAAADVVHRADSLDTVVKGLDNYKPLSDVAVTFGFDKAVLTKDDKAQLDGFAGNLASTKSYILEVTGGTDSTGSAEYNYALSQRRADAVVQYLASKYDIPARRFYLIGIGKDKEVADNNTRDGRAKNRRVDIQILSNQAKTDAASTAGAQ